MNGLGFRKGFWLFFCVCVLGTSVAVEPVRAENRGYLGEYGAAKDQPHEITLIDRGSIEDFYSGRNGEPFWIKGVRLNRNAETLIKALDESWTHGLNPETYHLSVINEITHGKARNRQRLPLKPEAVMTFELMLTDAYMRYVRDLSGMRVSAAGVDLEAGHWRQALRPAEALVLLEGERGDEEKLRYALDYVAPKGATYLALQAELIRLAEQLQKEPELIIEQVSLNHPLFPGRSHKEVPKLRRRFGIGAPAGEETNYVYDVKLMEAVKDFQAKKGLSPDGVIGTKTLYALNQGLADRVIQLALNLERLRWMPPETARRVIMVNLPSATLWALEEGKPVLEMPVIVGRPKRATPSFRTNIVGVRFNPAWTVPPTIQKEDILPKLIEDPGVLVDRGMELYSGYGADAQTLDPKSVDWAAMTPAEYKAVRIVQVPGANNPLGRIRILMPNRHNIYLHDTNDRKLFSRSDRAQSSGCIRLQEPEKLASFILSTRKGWTDDGLNKYLKEKKTRDVMIPDNIPVYLLYNTAWIGPQGQVVFGEDLYGYDKKLFSSLVKLKGIFLPGKRL
ncbi:MAG: L,D-transpeptidase family protein [Alphaproteobacteria bacterium]|nr:L,D-transpeptidase family protein [Alphaproteobacteria bacterium]MCB9975456.1 L,D-transpeptidase family protein [Rhodospirillales bacterium]